MRTLLFGYFGRKIYAPVCISRWRRWHRTYALVPGDGGQHHQLSQYQPFNAGAGGILGAGVAGGYNLAYNVAVVHR